MLDLVEFHTKRDLVKINFDKSEVLTYKCKNEFQVTFDGQEVKPVKTIKDLGLDRNTKNAADAESRILLARKTAYSLLLFISYMFVKGDNFFLLFVLSS